MTGLGSDLSRLIGSANVRDLPEDVLAYANDATHYFKSRPPDAVVLPTTKEEVAAVLKYASTHTIPVTPRGAGSGLSGGCTPVKGGIVMDMKRMNRLIEIDDRNMTAIAEAGMVLDTFHKAVAKRGLFYPPDPQSMTVCTLGGNVSTRAGGPRGVKYGTTGQYVTGLELVLPDGEIIKTGGKFVKHSVGYDLTHLLTGAEGTLGVITQVNVRLLPQPEASRTVVVACGSLEQTAEVVSEVIARGAVPAMMEFMTQRAADRYNALGGISWPPAAGYLLIALDGSQVQIEAEARKIQEICSDLKAIGFIDVADPILAAKYWKTRSNGYPLLMTTYKRVNTEDITVPRNRLPDMVRGVQAISASIGIMIGLGGHAGDGNIHPTVLQMEVNDDINKKAKQAIDAIIRLGLDLGGAISGEHGIGIHKAEYLEWELGSPQIALMRRIKAAFDPKAIMNPGKIWTEGEGAHV